MKLYINYCEVHTIEVSYQELVQKYQVVLKDKTDTTYLHELFDNVDLANYCATMLNERYESSGATSETGYFIELDYDFAIEKELYISALN